VKLIQLRISMQDWREKWHRQATDSIFRRSHRNSIFRHDDFRRLLHLKKFGRSYFYRARKLLWRDFFSGRISIRNWIRYKVFPKR
jgi:hypothetical protein